MQFGHIASSGWHAAIEMGFMSGLAAVREVIVVRCPAMVVRERPPGGAGRGEKEGAMRRFLFVGICLTPVS